MKRLMAFFGLFTLSFLVFNCQAPGNYQIEISGLAEEALLPTDSVTVAFSILPEDWKSQGYKIHVLLDGAYLRFLDEQLQITYTGLRQGAHALIGLLCDKNGVSVKSPGAVVIRNFFVKTKTEPLIHLQKPLLILHQPQKETFRGEEGMRILFDFRVWHAALGQQLRIHYNLDGLDYFLTEEKPVWIKNARRIGAHELTVRLENVDGTLVKGNPFNAQRKKFLVVEK